MNEELNIPQSAAPTAPFRQGGQMQGREQERTPEMIGAEIRMYVDAGRRVMTLCAIEIGRRLVEAKGMLNHGEWLPWLKKETDFSERSAQLYMQVFNKASAAQLSIFGPEAKAQTFADLPISKTLALLSLPESEQERFMEEVDVESLSVRKLEALVKERTEELNARKEEAEATLKKERDSRWKAEKAREEADTAREEAENARAEAEEQLRRIKAELDEIEKRPQAVAYERDEEAIAKAANDAADAERAKYVEQEKKLKAKIAELEEQAKKNDENLRTAHDDIRKAKADARDAREAVQKAQQAEAEAERLRIDLDALKKQLSMAAPEVAAFKAAFDRAQDELVHMNEALHSIQDEEIKAKLRKASLALLDGISERVKE